MKPHQPQSFLFRTPGCYYILTIFNSIKQHQRTRFHKGVFDEEAINDFFIIKNLLIDIILLIPAYIIVLITPRLALWYVNIVLDPFHTELILRNKYILFLEKIIKDEEKSETTR